MYNQKTMQPREVSVDVKKSWASRILVSMKLFRLAARTIKADKSLLALQLWLIVNLILSMTFTILILLLVSFTFIAFTGDFQNKYISLSIALLWVLTLTFVASFIVNIFNVALCHGSLEVFKGNKITAKQCLKVAWTKKRIVSRYSLTDTTIGIISRIIQTRFRTIASIASLSALIVIPWNIATYLVAPIIATSSSSRDGVTDTVQRSVALLKSSWTETITTAISTTIVYWLITIFAVLLFIPLMESSWTNEVKQILAIIFIIAIFTVYVMTMTMRTVIKAAIYFYVTSGRLPRQFESIPRQNEHNL